MQFDLSWPCGTHLSEPIGARPTRNAAAMPAPQTSPGWPQTVHVGSNVVWLKMLMRGLKLARTSGRPCGIVLGPEQGFGTRGREGAAAPLTVAAFATIETEPSSVKRSAW